MILLSTILQIAAPIAFFWLVYLIAIYHRNTIAFHKQERDRARILTEDNVQLSRAMYKLQYGSEGSMSKNKCDIVAEAIKKHIENREEITDLYKE